mmetsp:Transcript_33340/g.99289  ORF Transcript_33340/g.99289 Transcript_33340/m.99289 type:complete len:209 (+) Transcript_33340:730-1356(+)
MDASESAGPISGLNLKVGLDDRADLDPATAVGDFTAAVMLRPLWPAPEGATAASASALDKGIAGCGIVRPDTGGAAARAACLFLPPRAAAPAVAASPSPPPNAASVPPAAWREALVSQRPEPARPPSLPSSSLPPQLLTSNDATRESPAFENACNAALARPAWMAAASGSMPCRNNFDISSCARSWAVSSSAATARPCHTCASPTASC